MRKYIKQINSDNFVYPNNTIPEYDIDIVHNINNNSVIGSVSGFTAVFNGANIDISFNYTWNLNNGERFIGANGKVNVLSVHMMDPSKTYYQPWRCVNLLQDESVVLENRSGTLTTTVTPSLMGLSSFSAGVYNFEIRMIGKKSIDAICVVQSLVAITPTPTPSGGVLPTPTPTPSSGITVTPTPSSTGYPPGTTRTPTPTPTLSPTSTPLTPIYTYKLGTGTTATNACNDYDPALNNNYYSYCAPSGFTNGCYLYKVNDYPLSTYADNGYYANSGYSFYVTSGYMVGYAPCTYTPTPTPTPTQTNQAYGFYTGSTYGNGSTACAADVYPQIGFYLPLNITTPTVGAFFYKDAYCTPGNTFVGNYNFYKVRQNSSAWGIQVGPDGQIMAVTNC